VLTTELGAQNAVAGGGRYDGLIKLLGGPPDPGIGFAIGLERVVLLLGDAPSPGSAPTYLIPIGDAALHRLLPVAVALRGAGMAVELAYGARRLQRELERADRLGAATAVILGDEELAAGEAVVRDLGTGAQRRVPLAQLAGALTAVPAEPA
jgi:histidyl-tRNA synthetase